MGVTLIIIGLILFVLLVIVHELGHFIAARRNGVEVEEFGIGFPPRAWSKKLKNKTLLSINVLPLGGFVKLKGEHDADTAPGSYGAANLWAKTKIIAAGVIMNLLVAIAMFTLLALIGMPKLIDNQFTVTSDTRGIKNEVLTAYVEPDSPAANAGLQTRDQLVAIGEEGEILQPIGSAAALPQLTREYGGKQVAVEIKRDGESKILTPTLRTNEEVEQSKDTDEPKGYLGVSPTEYRLQRSTWSAPIVGVGLTAQFAQLTYKGLASVIADLFRGNAAQAGSQVAGPVGIFVLIKDGSSLGIEFILMIIAVISLTLALMNALPIPALDGGRLFVTYLYRLLKKPLTPKAEERIHGTGFALLMLLFVLITVVDVRRFF